MVKIEIRILSFSYRNAWSRLSIKKTLDRARALSGSLSSLIHLRILEFSITKKLIIMKN